MEQGCSKDLKNGATCDLAAISSVEWSDRADNSVVIFLAQSIFALIALHVKVVAVVVVVEQPFKCYNKKEIHTYTVHTYCTT